MLSIRALAIRLGALHKSVLVNESLDKRNLFRGGDDDALAGLNRLNEICSLQQ